MNAIWKFPIEIDDEFELNLPVGADLLDVQIQNGKPVLWAIVDPNADTKPLRFYVIGTGRTWRDDLAYVATFQVGAFVGHLFHEKQH